MEEVFPIQITAVLLLIASFVAMAVKWVKVPYSVALVVAGLVIGSFHLLPEISMTPELILVVFLPALLFEASWNINIPQLKRNWLVIATLATIGVLITALIIGAILSYAGHIFLLNALVLASMLSATDPISVLAIFRKLNVSSRLTSIMEGESLLNDGTAVTLFQIVCLMATGNALYTPVDALARAAYLIVGGIMAGAATGFFASKIISYLDDHLLELMLTTLIAYGSLLLAQQISVSPVMAVVSAGVVSSTYKKTSMKDSTRLAINTFWEYAAFVVNSLVFLLIGLQVNLSLLLKYSHLICIGVIAVLISRLIVVYGLIQLVSPPKHSIPAAWRHLLFWGAFRGSLSIALALSLSKSFPLRQEIIVVTFGVVLFTLLVQGLTIEPFVSFLYKRNLLQDRSENGFTYENI